MIYTVNDIPKKLGEQKDLDELVLFASSYLELDDGLHLEIEFDSSLSPGTFGEASYEDDIAFVWLNPKKPKGQIEKTFFHEMCHIKQMVTGRLILSSEDQTVTWNRDMYDISRGELELFSGEYPWEAEAYQLEEEMYQLFRKET